MNSKELAYAKQCALAAKNWDTFQTVIRLCLKVVRPVKKTIIPSLHTK